ncbi:MAG: MATE family efflux transporter [Acidobacteriota bacterium]|nr:MATE family efflux transporter [Acidobacteriota bacterium]
MFSLATPLVLTELGWMAMGIVDTMFVGRVSAEAIGAVSLGTSVYYAIAVFASGLLYGLDTLVSQSFGAGNRDDCHHSLINGIWLSLFLIPGVMGFVWLMVPVMSRFGINASVLRDTTPYIRALNWSAPPLILFFCLRRYLQSIGVVRPILLVSITANLVNALGNWIFVFGNLGAPRLGAVGAGWSTCVSRVYMLAAIVLVIWRRDPKAFAGSWRPDFPRIGRLLKLGLPAAGQIGLETSVFATVTILIGKLTADILAGHQIALTVVSTTFMVPLGISSAAAVRVGHAIGRRDPEGASRAGSTALALGAGAMSLGALAMLLAPQSIARLFTPQAAIIAAAAPLLRVAAFFQLFDGLQVTATGALRGAGDTHTPMLCHFVGYWILGLPLGVFLCFRESLGAVGLWIGLSMGLIVIGIVLLWFWRRTARRLRRTVRTLN